MYPEEIVLPMKEELTENGFAEMLTPSDVENKLAIEGTTLVVITSVCGCSAGTARPGVLMAVHNSAIKPTPAEILNGISRKSSANTPPIADIGIAVKISEACFTELNVKYNSIKISANAAGTAIINRLDAACKFSNVPP